MRLSAYLHCFEGCASMMLGLRLSLVARCMLAQPGMPSLKVSEAAIGKHLGMAGNAKQVLGFALSLSGNSP